MPAIESLMGQGREAIDIIVDAGSFIENTVGQTAFDDPDFGPGAVVGSANLDGEVCTVIANDANAFNEKFPVVYAGIIGLEEGYKMAQAVYATLFADADQPAEAKRPIVLVVDTPGNGPGKTEEIFGMNKATGAYQLALAEARLAGHPIVAIVIGRAISGGFLCHGLQADHILSLGAAYGTMIHVMPLTSVSRIIRKDLETLNKLSAANPVFAAGPEFFHALGGVEEIVEDAGQIRAKLIVHVASIREAKARGALDSLGPWGRGTLGAERGGRTLRSEIITLMDAQFAAVADLYAPKR